MYFLPALHCRKTLFTSVHNFVHLNLCISLLLSYSVFVAGVSTAVGNTVSLNQLFAAFLVLVNSICMYIHYITCSL